MTRQAAGSRPLQALERKKPSQSSGDSTSCNAFERRCSEYDQLDITQGSSLQTDPLAEEVRVAMALNGGVSLAVCMGGSAAELDCARRAHLAPEPVTAADRRVYNALCEAFRRVLVIDLMSGSSAGGINGALLGASIRHRRRLNPNFLRNRWLELATSADCCTAPQGQAQWR